MLRAIGFLFGPFAVLIAGNSLAPMSRLFLRPGREEVRFLPPTAGLKPTAAADHPKAVMALDAIPAAWVAKLAGDAVVGRSLVQLAWADASGAGL